MNNNTAPKKEDFKRLSSYAFLFKKNLFVGIFFLLIAVGLELLAPFAIRQILDTELKKSIIEFPPILRLIALFLICNIIAMIFKYFSGIELKIMAMKIVKKMRLQIFEKMQQIEVSYFDNMPAGSIVSKITNDTEAVQGLYVKVLGELIKGFVYVIGVYVMLFRLNIKFAIMSLFLVPFVFVVIALYNKKARKFNDLIRRKISELNGALNETVQGISIIQAFNSRKNIENEYDKTNKERLKERNKLLIFNSLTSYSIVDTFKNIIFTVLIYNFGIQVVNQNSITTVGLLYVYIEYIELLFHNIHGIIQQMSEMSKSTVASSHVFEMIDKSGKTISSEKLNPIDGVVEFKDVSFYYKEGEYVLKNINIKAEKGQVIALVGHTGSGKSSIMNLLLKFYSAQKGEIFIDGLKLSELKEQAIRDQMGIVLQDPYLFNDTILNNVTLNKPDISRQDAINAMEMVGADKLLDSLKDGIDEMVVDHGAMLSSGQRQLISFARALAQNPKILILDEATSSIDSQTEEIIQNAMNILMKGRTTFIIAHRLSTIRNADKIYLLDKGIIAEQGTHEELIEKKGKYFEMYEAQNLIV